MRCSRWGSSMAGQKVRPDPGLEDMFVFPAPLLASADRVSPDQILATLQISSAANGGAGQMGYRPDPGAK